VTKICDDEPCPCGSGRNFGNCHGKRIRERKTEISNHITLTVTPEPDPGTRAVFHALGQDTILFRSSVSSDSYDCGQCSSLLATGIAHSQISNVVLKCASCGAYNDMV
jgi:hypothetical protein